MSGISGSRGEVGFLSESGLSIDFSSGIKGGVGGEAGMSGISAVSSGGSGGSVLPDFSS